PDGNWAGMERPAGQLRKDDIARAHDLLSCGGDPLRAETRRAETLVHDAAGGERRILTMIRHGDVERPRVLERGTHQVTREDRSAIVGNGDGAGAHHLPELGEPFPVLAD